MAYKPTRNQLIVRLIEDKDTSLIVSASPIDPPINKGTIIDRNISLKQKLMGRNYKVNETIYFESYSGTILKDEIVVVGVEDVLATGI